MNDKANAQELIVLEEIKYPAPIDELKQFVKKWENIPELNPREGVKGEEYKLVKAAKIKAVKYRTGTEDARKRLKHPALEYGRTVDTIAKERTEIVSDVEHRLAAACHKVEEYAAEQKQIALDKEKERVDAISEAIFELKGIPTQAIGKTSAELREIYDEVKVPDEEVYEERIDEALVHYSYTMNTLEVMIGTTEKAEDADRLLAEEKERQKQINIEREAEEAKDREEFAAEKKKLADEKAEFNRKMEQEEEDRKKRRAEAQAEELQREQEEENKRMAAAALEEAKIAKEEAAKAKAAEKKAKAATAREIKKVEAKAISELYDVINLFRSSPSQEIAGEILSAIIEGKITAVKWAYNE